MSILAPFSFYTLPEYSFVSVRLGKASIVFLLKY
jgi:hypothetical protein